MQYASKRDLGAYALGGKNSTWQYLVYGRLRPKHAVSEGSMTLAEDMRPEANRNIDRKPFGLYCHTG